MAVIALLAISVDMPASAQRRMGGPQPRLERYDAHGPGWAEPGDYYPARDGRFRRPHHCDRGTGGTILGAIAGGLLGNTVAGRGDRTIGTVAGAGAGALAGRALDRDC